MEAGLACGVATGRPEDRCFKHSTDSHGECPRLQKLLRTVGDFLLSCMRSQLKGPDRGTMTVLCSPVSSVSRGF